jgi:hypothetical protein
MVELTRAEVEALLWHLAVVDRAYGQDQSYFGAGTSVEAKLEAALAEEGVA